MKLPRRRIVLKIGTASIQIDGKISDARITDLVRQTIALRAEGWDVVIVSSGAVGAGREIVAQALKDGQDIETKQALAALGQPELMRRYSDAFGKHKVLVAQALLSKTDFERRASYLNVRNALSKLLAAGAVPIINENDVTATEELRIGDNDQLAAYVANTVDADLLVIVTVVGGLYTGNPSQPGAELVQEVHEITEEIEGYAKGVTSAGGTGGMHTKLLAAKLATQSGTQVVIAAMAETDVMLRVARGEKVGTRFFAASTPHDAHTRWILSRPVAGVVMIDAGAKRALIERKTSLLPIGITCIEGEFQRGDCIVVHDEENERIALGLANYGSDELDAAKGLHSEEIAKHLGFEWSEEAIHKDNLVLVA